MLGPRPRMGPGVWKPGPAGVMSVFRPPGPAGRLGIQQARSRTPRHATENRDLTPKGDFDRSVPAWAAASSTSLHRIVDLDEVLVIAHSDNRTRRDLENSLRVKPRRFGTCRGSGNWAYWMCGLAKETHSQKIAT